MSRKSKKKGQNDIYKTVMSPLLLQPVYKYFYPNLIYKSLISVQPMATQTYSIRHLHPKWLMSSEERQKYDLRYKLCKKCKNRFYNQLIESPVVCLENSAINKKGHCSKYRPNDFIISRRK
jgi:hypothetical protein